MWPFWLIKCRDFHFDYSAVAGVKAAAVNRRVSRRRRRRRRRRRSSAARFLANNFERGSDRRLGWLR